MCFILFLFFYSLVWAVPSACLHYEELWLPIRFGQFLKEALRELHWFSFAPVVEELVNVLHVNGLSI